MRIWPAEMENLSSQEGDLIKKWTCKRNKEWRICILWWSVPHCTCWPRWDPRGRKARPCKRSGPIGIDLDPRKKKHIKSVPMFMSESNDCSIQYTPAELRHTICILILSGSNMFRLLGSGITLNRTPWNGCTRPHSSLGFWEHQHDTHCLDSR